MTALLSSTGAVLASYYYDAFGNIVEQDGNFGNPYRYAGYMYDEESRLYNLNARFYDAKLARFMQEDTYLSNGADPLSLNLYAYCNNNPLMYYDPTGHYLSPADQEKLTPTQQKAIEKLTDDWNAAKAAGNTDAMKKANDDANAIRASAGYYGGTDGTKNVPTPPSDGIKVTDVVGKDNAVWDAKDRTITYTDSSGQKVVLSEANNDFYCASDWNAYFYNNVSTILKAAGATVTFEDDRGTGGSTKITITPPSTIPATTPQIIADILKGTTTLTGGKDYYIGWDDRAHFVDSSFGPAPVVPKPSGPHESLKKGDFKDYDKLTEADREAINNEIYKGERDGIFPVDGKTTSDMNSAYGYRDLDGDGVTTLHDGTDIAAPSGTEIYNMYYGEVVKVDPDTNGSGYGNYVTVRSTIDGKTVEILYGHMVDAPLVSEGDFITPGQQLGGVGKTGGGQISGDHLHVRVRVDGERTNPDPNYTRNSESPYGNNPYDTARPYDSYIPYK